MTEYPPQQLVVRSLDELVAVDLAQQLQQHDLSLTLSNFLAALLCAAIFRHSAPTDWVNAWLALQFASFLLHLLSGIRRRRQPLTAASAQHVMRAVTRTSLLSGLLWLIGIQLFWIGSNDWERVFLMCWMIGMAMIALHALHAHLPAFFTMFGACVGGIVIASLWHGVVDRTSVLSSVVLFTIMNVRFAFSLNSLLKHSLRGKHEIALLAESLRQEKNRAVSLSQSRSRFLAAASHDLRQPVHALSLFVDVLNENPPQEQARRILRHVSVAVKAMGAMFNALLDLSKLDAGMLRPQLRYVLLPSLLERIAAEETPSAIAKGLRLRCETSNLAKVSIQTDAILLERILRNLLTNAIRYTDSGAVVLRARVHGGDACITVADSGSGIPADRQADAFEEFVQLHSAERDREKGLGLGLSIVRRLVDLLQVRMALRSTVGRGTVFVLRVPLASADEAAPVLTASPSADRAATATNTSKPTLVHGDVVIVIDDDAEIRAAMSALITSWMCKPYCAASVQDLMPQLKQLDRPPRVLICDHQLREDQTGLAAITQLQAIFNEDVPAVIITGETSPERLLQAEASGWPLLHKPVAQAQLRDAINAALAIDFEALSARSTQGAMVEEKPTPPRVPPPPPASGAPRSRP